MFTGLIADVGTIAAIVRTGESALVTVQTGLDTRDFELGESIAVNGACLTVVRVDGDRFETDVSAETLARTNLGQQAVGARVNLERALRMGDRLGGHLVQGHVDGVGALTGRREADGFWDLSYRVPEALLGQVVEKGSITLDGVSLTVARLDDPHVSIAVVPHTAAHTALLDRAVGDPVNVETDLIGKYVQRALRLGPDAGDGVSAETLKKHGFL